MNDFALGWKIFLFIVEFVIFLVIAIKSGILQTQEEKEFLAEEKKKTLQIPVPDRKPVPGTVGAPKN